MTRLLELLYRHITPLKRRISLQIKPKLHDKLVFPQTSLSFPFVHHLYNGPPDPLDILNTKHLSRKLPAVAAGENILRLIQDGGVRRDETARNENEEAREKRARVILQRAENDVAARRTWAEVTFLKRASQKAVFPGWHARFTRFARPLVATSHSS